MAGEWIKMRVNLVKDLRIIGMADFLSTDRGFMNWLTDPVQVTCDRDAYEHVTRDVLVALTVTGALQVWGAANERGKQDGDDLVVSNSSLELLDQVAGIPGFGAAMEDAKFVVQDGNSLRFLRFMEHNSPASQRHKATHANRQKRYRERKKSDAARDVTVARHAPSRSDVREEKIREENIKDTLRNARDVISKKGAGEKTDKPESALAATCGGTLESLCDDTFVESCWEAAVELGCVGANDTGRQTVWAAAEQALEHGESMGLFFFLLTHPKKITNKSDDGARVRINSHFKGEGPAKRKPDPVYEAINGDEPHE